jgi:hypothetical protein
MAKIKEVEVDGYYFTNIEGLFWHSGCFWMNDEKVKEVFNNGSKSILIYGSQKRGVKKLRSFAKHCKIKLHTYKPPF